MALVKPDSARIAKIKVIGVGGGGSNAVESMVKSGNIKGVEFIVVNTDAQVLLSAQAATKLQIGEKLTKGLGVGGDPEIGNQAAEESIEKIKELVLDSDMVFVTAGMGGGTGTGASPLIARVAREAGALTVGVVTKPFAFEGTRRSIVAEEGLERLRDEVDTLIAIPNQRLMDVIDRKMTLLEAFKVADNVLGQAVGGIADIITTPGLINVDFADVKAIMKDSGTALLGIGTGVGENRSQMAARAAISSPLLDLSIHGARGVLLNIAGGSDITMFEVEEAARVVSGQVDPDANIIVGMSVRDDIKDQLHITVVATGFDEAAGLSSLGSSSSYRQEPEPEPEEEERAPEGIVSNDGHVSIPTVTPQPQFGSRFDPPQPQPEPNEPEKEEKSDEFGEKFEIPAFLRNRGS